MKMYKLGEKFYSRLKGEWVDQELKTVSDSTAKTLDLLFSNRNKKIKRAASTVKRFAAELTNEQKRALAVMESGHNVFLSGEAGTGKSPVSLSVNHLTDLKPAERCRIRHLF